VTLKFPGAADKVLNNVDSISGSGDNVTITDKGSITIKYVAKLDKTISFTVTSVNGQPALQNIKGITLRVGVGFAFIPIKTPTSWGHRSAFHARRTRGLASIGTRYVAVLRTSCAVGIRER